MKRLTRNKFEVSYSKVTVQEVEKRHGFGLEQFEEQAIPVSQMLSKTNPENDDLGKEEVLLIKHTVYEQILGYLVTEAIPMDTTTYIKEENINDLIFTIISPIIVTCSIKLACKLHLRREKKIITVNGKYGGFQEFVTVYLISVSKSKIVFCIEAKMSPLWEAKIQCLWLILDMG